MIAMIRPVPTPVNQPELAAELAALPTPHFEWIRADTIHMWRLQRPLSVQFAKKIARDFDPDLLTPLTISRRGGINHCLDGQHRLWAIVSSPPQGLGWGDQNLPCMVFDALTDIQESAFFHAQGPGVRRQLDPRHDHAVLVDKGDETALKLKGIVEGAGLTMATATARKGRGAVNAVVSLKLIMEKRGATHLGAILRLLRDTFDGEYKSLASDILFGTSAFLTRYDANPQFDRDVFVAKVKRAGLDAVRRDALDIMRVLRAGAESAFGRALLNAYNSGKRSKRLPDWVDYVATPQAQANHLAGQLAGLTAMHKANAAKAARKAQP